MFQGTQDKNSCARIIGIEVHQYRGEQELNNYLSGDCFCLVLLSKGKFCGEINEQQYTLYSPMIICFSHLDKVEYLKSDRSAEIYMISFDPIVLNQNLNMKAIERCNCSEFSEHHHYMQLRPFLEKHTKNKCFSINKNSAQTYEKRILKLARELSQQADPYWIYRARSDFLLLLYFIENLLFNYEAQPSENVIPREFADIVAYINTNIAKQITLDDLYAKFYINKTKLELMFHQYYNMPFRQYIKHRRLEIAKDRLRFTELSNADIADAIGLSSPQNFCKFFKSMTGISPKTFRKAQLAAIREDPRLKKSV